MPTRKHLHRLRLAARRWLSKDHRDFQTIGRLEAWRSRRSQPSSRPPMLEDRPRYAHLPALGRIVDVRREGVVLHLELFAHRVASDDRPLVLAREGAKAESADATTERLADAAPEGRIWTLTLGLN
jgi:hypothetical protein